MPQFATSPLTFAQLTEADLRHACGPAVFAEAERLEESGHVVDSGLEEEVLVGRVRGTWRRVEEVRVGAQGARLAPACTCGAGGFCRHVGALLLDWIRHRAEFAPPATSDSWSPAGVRTGMVAMQEIGGLVNTRARTLSEELALLLESNTAAQLRRIAQARGISYPKSRTKAEMVQLLATALASPASIDAALAQLADSALLALDAVQLCGAAASPDAEEDDDDFDEGDDFGMSEDLVGEVYLSLGGTEATPLAALTDRGLLFTHHIPRAVCARLRPLDYLLDDPTEALAPVDQATTQPAIDRLFLAVASALADGRISVSTSRRRQTTLPGWETVPMGEERQVSPQHPRLDPKGLALLAERSSLAPAVVEFVVEMLLAIGAVEAKDHLTARPDRLRQYFERSVAERWHLLGLAWLSLDEWSELLLICGAAGPFALTARGPFPHYTLPLIPEAFAFRG
ncbi:MAG TPA: hypothetical protein VFZ25_03410, partial [Chloroflexota bacterium]|nr:hypothetical protein [Chloroflexota bacterium]